MTKRNPDTIIDDLESEFDITSETEKGVIKKKRHDLVDKEYPGQTEVPGRSCARSAFDEEHGRIDRQKRRLMTLDVYSRHKELMNQYYLYYPGATSMLKRDTSKDRTDYDMMRENHKFLWGAEELEKAEKSSECRLAKRYYDKLFKEYCIAELSKYKENKVALRWRTEKEVRSGKGQFECGNKRCAERNGLSSWEVNFSYVEDNKQKNALIKLRLCVDCSAKLNYHSKKRRVEKPKKKQTEYIKTKRNRTNSGSTSGNQADRSLDEAENPLLMTNNYEDDTISSEQQQKETKLKEEAEKMMNIWKKSKDNVDPERQIEEDLDEFLEDMFM